MNGIADENKNAGTQDWRIIKPASKGEIEGFASATSVFPGETIKFYIRSKMPNYSMVFYRMGWYDGKGARLMSSIDNLASIRQPEPEINELKKVECFWNVNYELTIPEDWCTGVYLCKLSSSPDLFENYIIFSVKQIQGTRSTYLYQVAFNTFQAYNMWGGYSLYGSREALSKRQVNAIKYRAKTVSFNRPFEESNGSGSFFTWDYQLLRWMERNGMDVSYCSDIDLHEDNNLLTTTDAFICAGHGEYWSGEMYNHIEYALNNYKVGAAFMGANSMYWQVRVEGSYNGKSRNIVCYKCSRYNEFKEDPMYEINPALVTTHFRHPNINRPEQKIIGQMFLGALLSYKKDDGNNFSTVSESNLDLIFNKTDHWLFENTGINAGDTFPGLVGCEFDKVWAQYPVPENLILLARSPVKWDIAPGKLEKSNSNVTIYTKDNGNTIFSTGTLSWCWSLDEYDHVGKGLVSEKMQKLTENIFRFISKQYVRDVLVSQPEALHEIIAGKEESTKRLTEKKEEKPEVLKRENVSSIPQYNSRISKSKLAVYFFIMGGGLGLAIGYVALGKEITGLISGIVIGGSIGLVIDKVRGV